MSSSVEVHHAQVATIINRVNPATELTGVILLRPHVLSPEAVCRAEFYCKDAHCPLLVLNIIAPELPNHPILLCDCKVSVAIDIGKNSYRCKLNATPW